MCWSQTITFDYIVGPKNKCTYFGSIYTIEYRPTAQHTNTDALSRLPLPRIAAKEKKDVDSQLNLVQMATLPLTHVQLKKGYLKRPSKFVLEGWPKNIPPQLKSFGTQAMELTVEAECLLWGS